MNGFSMDMPMARIQNAIRIAANTDFQRMAETITNARKMTLRPALDVQNAIRIAANTDFQRMAETMANARKMADLALAIMETARLVAEEGATDGGRAGGAVISPKVPLLPGLANPWQQVRYWQLSDWLTFIAFVLAVVGIVLALRPPAGLTRAEIEEIIIRTVQETTRTPSATSCTTVPTTILSPSRTSSASTTVPSFHRKHDHTSDGRQSPSSR